MSLELTTIPNDADLIHAIEIRISRPFPAMMIANSLAGRQTIEWQIIYNCSIANMIKEAEDRGIDVGNIIASLPDENDVRAKLKDMPKFACLMGKKEK